MVSKLVGVITPRLRLFINPLLKIRSDFCQINKDMFRFFWAWSSLTKFAFGVDQLNSINEFSATITLISSSIIIVT
jgi:hypothetical protein